MNRVMQNMDSQRERVSTSATQLRAVLHKQLATTASSAAKQAARQAEVIFLLEGLAPHGPSRRDTRYSRMCLRCGARW
jgi:hypothetical protein